jgi:hypothetical protein
MGQYCVAFAFEELWAVSAYDEGRCVEETMWKDDLKEVKGETENV